MSNSYSPSHRKWRIAILDRAVALHLDPAEVAEEFASMMHQRPPNITEDEAKELAREFPFSPTHIFSAFQTEED
jgi:hypothetical protein